jgi:hypothetical protein
VASPGGVVRLPESSCRGEGAKSARKGGGHERRRGNADGNFGRGTFRTFSGARSGDRVPSGELAARGHASLPCRPFPAGGRCRDRHERGGGAETHRARPRTASQTLHAAGRHAFHGGGRGVFVRRRRFCGACGCGSEDGSGGTYCIKVGDPHGGMSCGKRRHSHDVLGQDTRRRSCRDSRRRAWRWALAWR